jgi:hypothetical protein
MYRRDRTVCRASATFQAGMKIHDVCLTLPNLKYLMRADLLAFAATDTIFLTQLQGYNILQISKTLHVYSSHPEIT